MKKILSILFVLIFASISSSEEKPTNIKRIGKYIAVFDLETKGDLDKNISHPLSESIRLEVVKAGRYEVIDRGNMDKILGEQKFQMSGCVSGGCIVEAGQILGVGKIITGSVSLIGRTYYFSLSIINVETGRIEKAVEDKCRCEKDELINASKRLVKKLFEKLGDQAQIIKDPVTGMEFVFVKGGCYLMGDIFGDGTVGGRPVHKACVDDFYMGKYEVTEEQWKGIKGSSPLYLKNGPNYPVSGVSWNDTQDFIKKLNQKTGKKYRLPTEAEWEYAARNGGREEKWAGTSDEVELEEYAWYDYNSAQIQPVGKKKTNGLGICDMSGNVIEWVADLYGPYDINAPINNPRGPGTINNITVNDNRVLRGGAFNYSSTYLQTTSRISQSPSIRQPNLGFRLVFSAI